MCLRCSHTQFRDHAIVSIRQQLKPHIIANFTGEQGGQTDDDCLVLLTDDAQLGLVKQDFRDLVQMLAGEFNRVHVVERHGYLLILVECGSRRGWLRFRYVTDQGGPWSGIGLGLSWLRLIHKQETMIGF